MESDLMACSISETDLCNSQTECDDSPKDKGQEEEDVLFLETDLSSMEHTLDNRSSSAEHITSQTDDCSYYIKWIVYIALAVPRGTFVI